METIGDKEEKQFSKVEQSRYFDKIVFQQQNIQHAKYNVNMCNSMHRKKHPKAIFNFKKRKENKER